MSVCLGRISVYSGFGLDRFHRIMPYLWIMAFCIVTQIALLYLRVGILLTCCKHLHDIIVSLGGEVWAHQTSSIPSLFIELHALSQECERSYICVLWVFCLFLRFCYWILELFRQCCVFRFSFYHGTCLIRHTKRPRKCVGLYRKSEYSGFILVNRNAFGPSIFVGCQRMSEGSCDRLFHCITKPLCKYWFIERNKIVIYCTINFHKYIDVVCLLYLVTWNFVIQLH
jgi:hypothetical protein